MTPTAKKPFRWGKFFSTVLLWVLLLIFVLPFVVVIIDAFKTNAEIMDNPLALTSQPTFQNFVDAFNQMNYMSALFNTVVLTIVSVALIAIASAMTAYYVVRSKSKAGKILFYALIASMMVPFQAIMIPLVTIYGHMGVLNSRPMLVYLYIGFGCGMGTFIFHGFIKTGVPISLEEAARIDGANLRQTFFLIVLPLLKPVFATLVVLDVLWVWNDYLLPSLVLTQPNQLTLPLSTYSFSGQMSVNFGPLIASLIMTILPVLIIYIFLQKYIVEGIVAGAVKT
ncbi:MULTISPECIES: carbohydrate ABC transporter permease [Caproicibacterium]|uniref:Carbohydrate ABC transporter permease n=1 Tax=Caproicibacterium argilliputei TaxID=3030016 RepID=A0AA97DBD1_9FIRM|nr:carbohydrate ABC transporter permease [Caproicibacterium argilliputei]WOC32498.1 carbohydrate ABC transporter permease [Caproicibacterium argilliputei]